MVTSISVMQMVSTSAKHKYTKLKGIPQGISQPALIGINEEVPPGTKIPKAVDPGVILLGEDGDPDKAKRPDWVKDGSFLVFRDLKQLVPEFEQFKEDNKLALPELTPEENKELLGARMVGRWKSGSMSLATLSVEKGVLTYTLQDQFNLLHSAMKTVSTLSSFLSYPLRDKSYSCYAYSSTRGFK